MTRRGPQSATEIDRMVGRNIAAARVLRGISSHDLATMIGVTPYQISKYEKGMNRIPAGRLYHIADRLGVEINFLFENGEACANKLLRRFARAARRLPPERLGNLAALVREMAGGEAE